MIDAPKTAGDAQKLYADAGKEFRSARCAHPVWPGDPMTAKREWIRFSRQCSRRPGHGPAKLYCKQHAKMVDE